MTARVMLRPLLQGSLCLLSLSFDGRGALAQLTIAYTRVLKPISAANAGKVRQPMQDFLQALFFHRPLTGTWESSLARMAPPAAAPSEAAPAEDGQRLRGAGGAWQVLQTHVMLRAKPSTVLPGQNHVHCRWL